MADENGRPVTEREWKMGLDAHLREHAIEREFRTQIADILEGMRREAKVANDVRLEGMNDFRRQLDQQAATFVTIDRWEQADRAGAAAIAAIGDEVRRRLVSIEVMLSTLQPKEMADTQHKAMVTQRETLLGLTNSRIDTLEIKQAKSEGRSAVYAAIGTFVSAAVIASVGSIMYALTR